MDGTHQQRVPNKSMWRKSRERRTAKVYHSRNFTAGHVAPSEHYLNRAGLRGRKRWVFLAILVVIFLIAAANLLLTCIILGVLRFNIQGVPYFIFKEDGVLVWSEETNIDHVGVADSVRAYRNSSLSISSQQNQINVFGGAQMRSSDGELIQNSSLITIDQSAVSFRPFTSMSILTSNDQQLLFANATLVTLDSPSSLQSLVTSRLTTSTLRSEGDLEVAAGADLNVRGAGGVYIGGRQVVISGGSGISLSNEASIQLVAGDGVTLKGLPTVVNSDATSPTTYHLCACASGKMFRVPANPSRCAGANENVNPCT